MATGDVTAQRTTGLLTATYTGFGLAGATGYEYIVHSPQLCNIVSTMITVDMALDDGSTLREMIFGSTVAPTVPAAPVAGVIHVLAGDTLRFRASAASSVACVISYSRVEL